MDIVQRCRGYWKGSVWQDCGDFCLLGRINYSKSERRMSVNKVERDNLVYSVAPFEHKDEGVRTLCLRSNLSSTYLLSSIYLVT